MVKSNTCTSLASRMNFRHMLWEYVCNMHSYTHAYYFLVQVPVSVIEWQTVLIKTQCERSLCSPSQAIRTPTVMSRWNTAFVKLTSKVNFIFCILANPKPFPILSLILLTCCLSSPKPATKVNFDKSCVLSRQNPSSFCAQKYPVSCLRVDNKATRFLLHNY